MHVGDGDAWLKFNSTRNVHNKNFTQACLLIRYEKNAHSKEAKREKSHSGGRGTRVSDMSFLLLSLENTTSNSLTFTLRGKQSSFLFSIRQQHA